MHWEQFRAILWLRWRLTRNQLRRGGKLGAVIAALATVMLVIVALGITVGATLAGAFPLKDVSAPVIMYVWDGITVATLFLSIMGVLADVQRSESIDLARLLHLPVSLRQVFVFNYLVSLVSFGTVAGLAGMLGLAVGLAIGRGLAFLLLPFAVVGFLFMVTAWIYCLRGWLLSIMVNQRRRRTIIMGITLGIVLVAQSPNLINIFWQRKARAERQARREAQAQSAQPTENNPISAARVNELDGRAQAVAGVVTQAHPWVPVLWLANGARGLANGQTLPVLWGAAGMFALGWLGIRRAYRATLRFYRSEGPVKAAKKTATPGKTRNWVEWSPPWLPDDVAGLALAQFRSMTRAPEIRMMLATGIIVAVLVPLFAVWGQTSRIPESVQPFIGTGVVLMTCLTSLQLACNQFGYDRDGFRGLVLLPSPRERLLLGKNLALLPVLGAIALLPLAVIGLLGRLPVLAWLASAPQFVAAFCIVAMGGNVCSILLPGRIAVGSLKPTKPSWVAVLDALGTTAIFPVAVSPVIFPPALGWAANHWLNWPAGLVNLAASFALAALLGFLYRLSLRPLGRLLQRRETKVLLAVTEKMD